VSIPSGDDLFGARHPLQGGGAGERVSSPEEANGGPATLGICTGKMEPRRNPGASSQARGRPSGWRSMKSDDGSLGHRLWTSDDVERHLHALLDAELLALVLSGGCVQEKSVRLAREVLAEIGGLFGWPMRRRWSASTWSTISCSAPSVDGCRSRRRGYGEAREKQRRRGGLRPPLPRSTAAGDAHAIGGAAQRDAGPPADRPLSEQVESEVGRMRESLFHLIEFSGMSRREVERRLCERGCGTDLGRLLSGRLDLKMQHVLAICRVIDLAPPEFFQIALKPRPGPRSPLLRRLEALLPAARAEIGPPAPPSKALDLASMLHRVQDLLEKLNDLMREAARGRDHYGRLPPPRCRAKTGYTSRSMSELIFLVEEAPEGGYTALSLEMCQRRFRSRS
jgi:hypothetical protein